MRARRDPHRPDCLPPKVDPVHLHSSLTSSCSSATLRFRLFFHAEGEIESCALVDFSLCPHAAPMLLNDPLHRCQADARALEIFRTMQPLEDSEQFVHIFHVEANAVVPD